MSEKTAAEMIDDFRKKIHANAREATARQVYRAVIGQERPDIAIALILQALDDWYQKGLAHATTQRPAMTGIDDEGKNIEGRSEVFRKK